MPCRGCSRKTRAGARSRYKGTGPMRRSMAVRGNNPLAQGTWLLRGHAGGEAFGGLGGSAAGLVAVPPAIGPN